MSKQVEPGLKYTQSHEWVRIGEGNHIQLGISDHAQDSLGDITYFELPEVGRTFKAGEAMGFVESVKAVSDIYAPADLKITGVNLKLKEQPELTNRHPYGEGWYVEADLLNADQLRELMDAKAYEVYLKSEQ
jgi:glycine cleavage system H protein